MNVLVSTGGLQYEVRVHATPPTLLGSRHDPAGVLSGGARSAAPEGFSSSATHKSSNATLKLSVRVFNCFIPHTYAAKSRLYIQSVSPNLQHKACFIALPQQRTHNPIAIIKAPRRPMPRPC